MTETGGWQWYVCNPYSGQRVELPLLPVEGDQVGRDSHDVQGATVARLVRVPDLAQRRRDWRSDSLASRDGIGGSE